MYIVSEKVDKNPDTNEPISLACLANNVLNQASARPQVPPREISENRPMTSRNLACLPGTPLPETFKITGVSRSEHAIKTTLLDTDFARSLMLQRDNILTKSIHAKETQVTPHHSQERAGIIACTATSPGTSRFIAPCLTDVQKVLISCLRSENTNSNNTINVEIVARPNISDPDSHNATQESNDDVINVNIKYNEGSRSKAVKVESQNPEIAQKHVMTNTPPDRLGTRSEYNLVANESMSSIGSNVCRICMTAGRERLISPCNCKGSLANVHLSCLERWLNQVGRSYCELCGFRYPAIRTPRYTMVEALRLWCGNPRNRHHLQSDCLIFWLLSTLAGGLVAVCVIGTQYFVLEGRKFGISNRVTETVMDFFMTIVLCGYFVTAYLLWKDHYVLWNRWRRASVNVRLIINPDTNFRSLRADIC